MGDTICFFNTAIAWGGGEKWHFETSKYLFSKGHNVIVFAHTKSALLQKLKKNRIPHEICDLSNVSFLNPIAQWKLRQKFLKHNIGTIVINLSRDLKIAGICAKNTGTKRIIYRRGSAIPIRDSFLNRYYFKHIVNEVLANSKATKETILQNNSNLFPSSKIRVIYNGIEIPQQDNCIEQNVPKTNRKFRIINLGRLEHQKNQLFLLRLAEDLIHKQLEFEMHIGGTGRLGPMLQKAIKDLHLENYVFMDGYVEEPLSFMKKGDVFVLPSLWEGFGYVLAEASVSELPVVAFNLSSNPELIVDGKTGYLTPKNDLNRFAEAVEKLYRDRDMARTMGRNGKEYIVGHFDRKKRLQETATYLIDGK